MMGKYEGVWKYQVMGKYGGYGSIECKYGSV